MPIKSFEYLQTLSAGHQLNTGEIDDLRDGKVCEDLHLEYKHGNMLQNSDASSVIREYTSCFANSDGGILIIGIDAPSGVPSQITGCIEHNKGNLSEWAARCLTEIASYFSPLPKFQVVSHPNGDILVIIVSRSLGLVPTVEAGRIFYYIRIHDQTLKAPDYLMADLLVGRRQRPVFDIGEFKLLNFARVMNRPEGAMDLAFDMRMRFENQGMVWAESSRWGLVAWVKGKDSPIDLVGLDSSYPSSHLMSFIDAQDISVEKYKHQKNLLHIHASVTVEKPFDVGNISVRLVIPLRFNNDWFSYTWKAAIYITSRNSLPVWYQVNLIVTTDIVKLVDEKATITNEDKIVFIDRLVDKRPQVAWDGL